MSFSTFKSTLHTHCAYVSIVLWTAWLDIFDYTIHAHSHYVMKQQTHANTMKMTFMDSLECFWIWQKKNDYDGQIKQNEEKKCNLPKLLSNCTFNSFKYRCE